MKQLKPDVWLRLGGEDSNSTIIIGGTGVIVVGAKTKESDHLSLSTVQPADNDQ